MKLVVADAAGDLVAGKALTTPKRSFEGLSEGLKNAAGSLGIEADALLAETEVLIYGTTRATNAIVTGATAKTAMPSFRRSRARSAVSRFRAALVGP